MKMSPSRNHRQIRFNNDTLESRDLPATFGIAWPNAQHLSVSFAPESTSISGRSNELNSVLGAQFGANLSSGATAQSEWKSALLRAFSTWSAQSNINFVTTSDNGAAFGANGQISDDANMGDIRIGGVKLTNNVLAVSMPYDPAASGTNSGDIILNTNQNLNDSPDELYRVALHEIGHTLGINNSSSSDSVMSRTLSNRLSLSALDVASIQSLYGARNLDAYDAVSSNGTPASATSLDNYISSGSRPVLLFGDLTSSSDLDHYKFRVPAGYSGPVTIRLQTAGVSLLQGKLSVLDSNGNSLGQVSLNQLGGGMASITLPNAASGTELTIRIESLENSGFQVGAYGLAVTFDSRSEVSPQAIGAVLNGKNLGLNPSQLQRLASGEDLEGVSSEQFSVTTGVNRVNYSVSGRFDGFDVNSYKINAMANRGSVATIRVTSLGSSNAKPTVTLTNSNGQVIASRVILNNGQQMTIEAFGVAADTNLRVKVQSATGQNAEYRVDATFGNVSHTIQNYMSGQVSSSTPSLTAKFYVAQPQVFQLSGLVQSQSGNASNRVTWSIINSLGQVVWTNSVASGLPTTGNSVLLNSGEYRIQVKYDSGNTSGDTLRFQLTGDCLTDPVGPIGIDATIFPQYQDPNIPGIYIYPGGVILDQSYYIFIISDPNYDPYGNLGTGGWIA